MTQACRGIFQVWNPRFNPDTLLSHAKPMADMWLASSRKKTDRVHVWWGKIGYAKRPGDILSHIDDLEKAAKDGQCWLFLTDYQTFHACPVDRIEVRRNTDGQIMPAPSPKGNVPEYYSELGYDVLYWFRLRDIILVESDPIPAMERIGDLLDIKGRPVDLYASRKYEHPIPVSIMPESPLSELIYSLTESSDRLYAADTLSLPQGVHKAYVDIRDMLKPEFESLPQDVRVFLADGKFNYDSDRTDYSSAILQFVKAYEVLIRKKYLPQLCRWWEREGLKDVRISPKSSKPFWLSSLADSTNNYIPLVLLVDSVLRDPDITGRLGQRGGWVAKTFAPKFKGFLKNFRNPAVHEMRVPKEVVTQIHDRTLCSPKDSWITRLNSSL